MSIENHANWQRRPETMILDHSGQAADISWLAKLFLGNFAGKVSIAQRVTNRATINMESSTCLSSLCAGHAPGLVLGKQLAPPLSLGTDYHPLLSVDMIRARGFFEEKKKKSCSVERGRASHFTAPGPGMSPDPHLRPSRTNHMLPIPTPCTWLDAVKGRS